MKPYYQDEYATIYHGDCREVLPELGPVDLVLTDPPFSATTHLGARSAPNAPYQGPAQVKIDFAAWDYEAICAFYAQLAPVVSGWLVATMDWRHIYRLEESTPMGWRFVRFGVWVKPNSAPQFTGDRPATGWEGVAILHRADRKMSWNGGGNRAVWTHNIDSSGIHPTAKPVSLVAQWLKQFALFSETVLDPFMGSGTTLRAAKDLGIHSIGIELEERYCEIAAERLRQEVLAFA